MARLRQSRQANGRRRGHGHTHRAYSTQACSRAARVFSALSLLSGHPTCRQSLDCYTYLPTCLHYYLVLDTAPHCTSDFAPLLRPTCVPPYPSIHPSLQATNSPLNTLWAILDFRTERGQLSRPKRSRRGRVMGGVWS